MTDVAFSDCARPGDTDGRTSLSRPHRARGGPRRALISLFFSVGCLGAISACADRRIVFCSQTSRLSEEDDGCNVGGAGGASAGAGGRGGGSGTGGAGGMFVFGGTGGGGAAGTGGGGGGAGAPIDVPTGGDDAGSDAGLADAAVAP